MKKIILALFLILFLLPSFASALDKATPEATGLPSQAVLNFLNAVEEKVDALHGIVIVRNGKIIAEGSWAPYKKESPHVLYSLSKSFASTAIGIAVDEGLLNLDDKVVSFFPEETPKDASQNLLNMRIRDLLCMGTGNHNDTLDAIKKTDSKNWPAVFLAQPVEHEPGTHFRYNTGATYMLSAILQKVSGKTLLEFLTPRLFQPLGIDHPTWETDPVGRNTAGYGLKIRTKDIANFGQLYLQKGIWKDKRLLSEKWIAEATSKQIDNGSNPKSDWNQGYGFQFWRCKNNAYRGDGAFGQYCLVMPDQQTVIAINSGLSDMQKVLNLVWELLLPEMTNAPLAENKEAQSQLNAKLNRLALPTAMGSASSPQEETIFSKTFKLEENDKGLKSISFQKENGQTVLKLQNAHGEQTIPFSHGTWTEGDMTFEKELKTAVATTNGLQKIATSSAWLKDDCLRLWVYMNETPYRLQFDFTFKENSVILNLEYNVFFGPKKWQVKSIQE